MTCWQGAVIWAAARENCRFPLVFLLMGRDGLKINPEMYRKQVLKASLLPWPRKKTIAQTKSHRFVAITRAIFDWNPASVFGGYWRPRSVLKDMRVQRLLKKLYKRMESIRPKGHSRQTFVKNRIHSNVIAYKSYEMIHLKFSSQIRSIYFAELSG